MKRSFLLGLLGLAATALTAFGQGTIVLDNYNTSGPNVTYATPSVPVNGISGPTGVVGASVVGNPSGTSPWTVGFYYVLGNVTIGADPNPIPEGDPSTFTGGLQLATGPGSTAGINDIHTRAEPGEFLAGSDFAVPGTSAAGGQVVTMELVIYSGSTYDSSIYRSHNNAFQITTTGNTELQAAQVGRVMTPLAIYIDPEPSVFALSSLSAAALILSRRNKTKTA